VVDSSQDLPWWGLLPEYQQITLQDYPQRREFMPGRVMFFPLSAYQDIGGEMVTEQIDQLRGLITAGPALPEVETLPYLPLQNAHQVFHAKAAHLVFEGGVGVRYITAYAQGPWPLAESEIFYTFQGMTSEGEYYIAAQFPMLSNILPETPDASAVDPATFESDLAETVAQLNNLTPDQFTPDLHLLDQMMESIVIAATD